MSVHKSFPYIFNNVLNNTYHLTGCVAVVVVVVEVKVGSSLWLTRRRLFGRGWER